MYDNLTTVIELFKTHLDSIKDKCKQNNQTIAVAESVTSGCLQLILSNSDGAQDFFQGGITVYNCSQKSIHLGIEPIYADSCQGVDPLIAAQMARHVCTMFRSQIGISITGYATKIPEDGINELYAYIAIVDTGELILQERIWTTYEGVAAQWDYTSQIIKKLAYVLR